MTTLSDYRDRSFGYSWGLLVEETKLLARSVYLLDASGHIAYAQLVSEGTNEPDYEPVLEALDELLARS
jgi:thiol peroxidase